MKIARFVPAAIALWFAVSAAPVVAQTAPANPALGIVTHATKAHIGNADITEGSSVYTGDYISTEDGGDLSIRIGPMSLDLLNDSAAHIYTAPYGAVVELNRGTAVYTTPGARENLVIVASDVRATPDVAQSDMGRVSLDDPCNVTVASQRGQVNVQVGKESRIVEEGKAYRVRAENSIDYRKYISPDESDYHDYHEHKPCAPLEMVKGKPPLAAGQSRFLLIAGGAAALITGLLLLKGSESPDHP